jgi:fructose-1,6-bisphosphatase/inositol monophosphatase family enzyme
MNNPAPTSTSGQPAIDVARGIAARGGAFARERFRQPQDITVKGRGNLVTETDLALEALISDELRREFPDHAILSEETASDTSTDGWCWIIDPLDGTRNFVSGVPFWCLNLALCLDGQPVLGVTHDPNHDEMFWAERGAGAWINDQQAGASSARSLREAVIGVDLGYDDRRGQDLLAMARGLLPRVQALRVHGSAALGLAYGACGRYDIFIHHFLYPWDLAAGIILAHEAGGTITDAVGDVITLDSPSAVSGGRAVHAEYLAWQRTQVPTLAVAEEM